METRSDLRNIQQSVGCFFFLFKTGVWARLMGVLESFNGHSSCFFKVILVFFWVNLAHILCLLLGPLTFYKLKRVQWKAREGIGGGMSLN